MAREESNSVSDLVDEVADAIELRIVTGAYALGTRLRQEQLAQDFGISRTPVREALRKVQAAGLVELLPHRGAIVRGPSARDLREAYAVRAELEGFGAELAARWITDRELAGLRAASERFRIAVDRFAGAPPEPDGTRIEGARQWIRANDELHGVVQTASRNLQLQRSINDVLHRCLRPGNASWSVLSHNSHLLQTNVAQHEDIVRALELRDGRAARELMTAHILNTGEHVATWFEQAHRPDLAAAGAR